MITFKQFINKDERTYSATVSDCAALILKNCKPFFKETGFNPADFDTDVYSNFGMFRGMDIGAGAFRILSMQKNRKPRDSSKRVHNTLDEYFVKKFGHPYRSECVFVYGDEDTSSGYGPPYLIIPIGEFSYIWSKSIGDAYAYFENAQSPAGWYDIKDALSDTMELLSDDNERPSVTGGLWQDAITAYLNMMHPYTNENIAQALNKRRTEVMLNCPHGYYAIKLSPDKQFAKDIMDELTYLLK